jgi:type VI secretion system protein ImpG
MDPQLLKYYNRELQHVREMGGEFAKQYPKIAGRLGLEGFECADPYVERLLEGFAFLAARVQLKVDAEFPRFTQHLLEMVYPHYLAPTPSMTVVQLNPDMAEGALANGYVVPRGSVLRSVLGRGDVTSCEYRTAHDATLWPLEITGAEYLPTAGSVAALGVSPPPGTKAALKLTLKSTADIPIDQIALDRLALYIRGSDELPMRLYEQMVSDALAVVVRPGTKADEWQVRLDKSDIRPLGFSDDEALLPFGPQSFQGYRLIQEYFVFPQRYLFVELGGLSPAVRRCSGDSLEILMILDRSDSAVENAIDETNFALFATPAINLFPKRTDRIHLTRQEVEHHAVPDRTRPMDFEIFQVTGVVGYGASSDQRQPFLPFYTLRDKTTGLDHQAYFTVYRKPRLMSSRQRDQGPRSSYLGSEVYLCLVDAKEAPYSSDLKQLAVETLCTNRDLPLHMPIGRGATDFTMESGAPVLSVRCLTTPTRPRPSLADDDVSWRLISHLSLNYLSLVEANGDDTSPALRDLLRLYGASGEASMQRQIDGITAVASRPINRRLPSPGPITFGRGLELTLTCDETAFEGTGIFLLGSVLERFFSRYVSINSFVETVLSSVNRGEVMRWPVRMGCRHIM